MRYDDVFPTINDTVKYYFSRHHPEIEIDFIRLSQMITNQFVLDHTKIQPLKIADTDLLVIKMKNRPTKPQMNIIAESIKDLNAKALIMKDTDKVFTLPEEQLNNLGYYKKKDD